MASSNLPDGYRIVELSDEEAQKHWNEWGPQIFSANDTSMNLRLVLSEEERLKVRSLHQNMKQLFTLNLAIFKGDEFCGWCNGDQYNVETYYMRNSAIVPAHRGKGLYKALMNEVLERVGKMGFQIVLSRHVATNNSIIIPKLKAGFVITAMELSDRFGTLVHLSYFYNQMRRDVVEFRAGDLKPDQKMKEALGIP